MSTVLECLNSACLCANPLKNVINGKSDNRKRSPSDKHLVKMAVSNREINPLSKEGALGSKVEFLKGLFRSARQLQHQDMSAN